VATNDVLNARLSGMKYDIYSDLSLGVVYRFKNKKDGKKSFATLTSFDDENFSKLTNLLDNHDSVLKEANDKIVLKNQIIEDQKKEIAKLKEDLYSVINNKNEKKLSNPSLIDLVVEFTINQYNIEEKQKPNIYLVSEMLKKDKSISVTLVGYGDKGTGTDYVNRQIGWARARSVKSYLINHGISEDRIKTVSVGSDSQIFEKNNWNRAVAFVFSN
jgi:outer membrane protein OmpA-like peptidoglycan-associated protein